MTLPRLRLLWSPCLLLALFNSCLCQPDPPGFDGEICYGPECCHSLDNEFGRQFACAMYVYLDSDPVLQMEGCAKHGAGCRAVCQGEIYDLLSTEYKRCDETFDKNTVIADWLSCFFEAVASGLVNGVSYADSETIPAINTTEAFCRLFTQPGCPLCIALRIPGSPCAIGIIQEMCKSECQACRCHPPNPTIFRAKDLDCDRSDSDEELEGFGWGDSCKLTCPANTSSASDIECVMGFWNGSTDNATCMNDCQVTGITLPDNGTNLKLAGWEGDDDEENPGCDYLKHRDRCALNCEFGTTPSSWWECYDGNLRSTVPPYEPLCLENCGEPPLPPRAEAFGNCTNPVLEDPDYEVDWSGLFNFDWNFNWSRWNSSDNNSNWTLNGTALRQQLDDAGFTNFFAETCKALKEDNDQRPAGEQDSRWNWRRLRALDPAVHRPGSDPSYYNAQSSLKSLKRVKRSRLRPQARRLAEENSSNDTNGSNETEDDDDGIFVPANTPHGSTCELRCQYPFTPDHKYLCWNNTWTMPDCIVQLLPNDIRWPIAGRSIVSPLGSLYLDYNLDITSPSMENLAIGEKVTVCAKEGIGCPTGQCFAAVPVEDGGKISTEENQLRVRFGYDYWVEQRYGCEYEITIPQGTVVAVVERSVGNEETTWSYKLSPPPPRLMALELEPRYDSVYVKVKYNAVGTIKCRVTPRGKRPSLLDMDGQLSMFVQASENDWARGEIRELEERTAYSLWCRGTGSAGISQSMVNVYDNEEQFTTKTRIPYAFNVEVVKAGHKEVTLSLLYSGEAQVFCNQHQEANSLFDVDTMEAWIWLSQPKMFITEPIEYTLPNLKPDMPTHIFCRARAYNSKGMVEWIQPLDDAWKWAQTTHTPAMTVTELKSLKADGCTLIPPFAPSRPVYACMLPENDAAAAVTLDAEVDEEHYSKLSCDGSWHLTCRQKFEVASSDNSEVWALDVRAQAGNTAPYVVVMMREAEVVPKDIIPKEFGAITSMQKMTICAAAKDDVLAKIKIENTYVQLLPGPWDVPLVNISKGADLPNCKCAGCNLELGAEVRGAGKDLILVIFVEGIPSFTLQAESRVHFKAPVVEDVNPPTPSIYEDSKLVVYGKNFGGTNSTGAVIKVEKVGPVIGLPAVSWFQDCPVLIVQVAKQSSVEHGSDMEPEDTRWVAGEYQGRYMLGERNRYVMMPDKFVILSEAQVSAIRKFAADGKIEPHPIDSGDNVTGAYGNNERLDLAKSVPNNIYLYILDDINMCCYEKIWAVGFNRKTRTMHLKVSENQRGEGKNKGRNLPRLQMQGKIWQFDSRAVRNFRMHSASTNLRQKTGWTVKYRNLPPNPGPEDRRLERQSLTDAFNEPNVQADYGGMTTLRSRLYEYQKMAMYEGSPDHRELQEEKEDETEEKKECTNPLKVPRNGTCVCMNPQKKPLNDDCETTCPEGTDKDHAVDSFLENMGMTFVPKAFRKCNIISSFVADICSAIRFICQCSCKDYDNTPISIPIEVDVTCERCGDGIVVSWKDGTVVGGTEECDDGNTRDGDGCNRECKVEPGWDCSSGTCINLLKKDEEERNLCGPTTWVDDTTLMCTLTGASRYPITLSVEIREQSSASSEAWIQYNPPSVRTMYVGVAEVKAGDSSQWTNILEFTGGQKIVLQGRSLPPTAEEGQKHRLTMLIGETILCAGVEVKSSTSFSCPAAQPILLNKVTLDPEVTIRVGEVSSEGMPLSRLGLKLRQPEIYAMEPSVFNDTDTKQLIMLGKYLGLPDFGDFEITIGGVRCEVVLHLEELVQCALPYVPIGSYTVQARLGNIDAISTANVTAIPTNCPVGMKRVEIETSECTYCEAGTAEDEVTADFFCDNCSNAMYQNDTGTTACKHCEANTFSVLSRSTKEYCRCEAGFYHKYNSADLAETCTKCEHARGFGWHTKNWTLDCEDCEQKWARPPEEWDYFGDCPANCYGLECHPCPRGAVCFGNAAWPRVLPGFWAVDVFERNAGGIERCMPMEACLGDDGFGKMVCETGYEGIRCGVCEVGYYKDQHKCWECPNNQWIFALIFMLFFICVMVFGVIPAQLLFMRRLLGIDADIPWVWRCWFKLCCCCRCCCKKRNNQQAPDQEAPPGRFMRMVMRTRVYTWDQKLSKAPLLRTMAMCLNFGHTCYAFAMLQRPAVNWPGPSWELLSWTKLLTIDVEFMKPDCVVQMPYFQKWVGKFFMPFGLIVLLFLVSMYLGRQVKREQKGSPGRASRSLEGKPTVWQVFRFSLALVIHVILIWHLKVALSPVDCNWCREGVTCLDEYTLVECWGDDPTWIKMMVISICDFIFVSGFFPLFLTGMLIRGWRATAKEQPKIRQGGRTSSQSGSTPMKLDFTTFFTSGYRGRQDGGYFLTYAWEVVVLFRKLSLIVSAKFTSTDPVRGANLQLLILLVSLVMQFTMRPYQAQILNNIDNFLCVLLFLALLSACQLTMGGLGDMEIAYVSINIAALFGGATVAVLVCLRKLMHAYAQETRRKRLAMESRVSAIGEENGVHDLVPADDVKSGPSEKLEDESKKGLSDNVEAQTKNSVEEEKQLRAEQERLLKVKQEMVGCENFEAAAQARDALRNIEVQLQALASTPEATQAKLPALLFDASPEEADERLPGEKKLQVAGLQVAGEETDKQEMYTV